MESWVLVKNIRQCNLVAANNLSQYCWMKFPVHLNGYLVSRCAHFFLRKCYTRSSSVYLWAADSGNDIYSSLKSVENSLSKVSKLSCGHGFTVASTNQQSLLVSGVNVNSQLGIPSAEMEFISDVKEIKLPLTKNDSKILDISCGRLHTVVLTSEGLLVAGCNRLGQCGLGNIKETQYFTKIPWSSQIHVKQVVCGLDHTLLLTHDGNVWSCGWGADGQTGLGHTDEQRTFAQIEELKRVHIKQLASKADSSLALSSCGSVFSWGNSEYNQVGFATDETLIPNPTKICGLENIVDIAIGGSVGLALTGGGEVFSWGYGFLGNSPEPCFNATPQILTNFDHHVVNIDCGLDFYVTLTDERKLYVWGRVGCGKFSSYPKQVALPSKVVHLGCGIDQMGVIVEK